MKGLKHLREWGNLCGRDRSLHLTHGPLLASVIELSSTASKDSTIAKLVEDGISRLSPNRSHEDKCLALGGKETGLVESVGHTGPLECVPGHIGIKVRPLPCLRLSLKSQAPPLCTMAPVRNHCSSLLHCLCCTGIPKRPLKGHILVSQSAVQALQTFPSGLAKPFSVGLGSTIQSNLLEQSDPPEQGLSLQGQGFVYLRQWGNWSSS